jgi:hypothetical protein
VISKSGSFHLIWISIGLGVRVEGSEGAAVSRWVDQAVETIEILILDCNEN